MCALSLAQSGAALEAANSTAATTLDAKQNQSTGKSAQAKPAAPIQTQFKAFRVHFGKDGKEELEPASSVSPGDVVEYVALHRNVSARRLLKVDFSIPIPFGTTLWLGSMQPASGVLQTLEAAAKDAKPDTPGKDRPRVVWRFDQLDPGQSVKFSLRVSIDADASLAPAPAPNPFRLSQPQLRKP